MFSAGAKPTRASLATTPRGPSSILPDPMVVKGRSPSLNRGAGRPQAAQKAVP
jgi:hypothetical protein